MLETIFGRISISIDDKEHKYNSIRLNNLGSNFKVDDRYKIVVDNIVVSDDESVIDCILYDKDIENLQSYPESGEDLALISFISGNVKLSMGVEGDIPGVQYEYLPDRLRVRISKDAAIDKLTYFVAWITMTNIEQEEIYTWFAADPTFEV